MRCEKCGSSWDSTVNLSKCPFCGAVLEEKKPEQFDNIPDVLAYIINTWGKETLAEQRLVSLVSDLCTGCDTELRLLRIAVQSGAYVELLKADGLPDNEKEQILLKQAAILHRKYFLDPTWVSSALSWLTVCLGWSVSEHKVSEKETQLLSNNTSLSPAAGTTRPSVAESTTVPKKDSLPSVPGLHFVRDGGGLRIEEYTGNKTIINIQESYDGLPVVSIGSEAFRGNSNITSVTLPDNVLTIGDLAFYGCTKLTAIVLPAHLTGIGYRCFFECKSLSSVSIPDSVTEIGVSAFCYCESLKQVRLSCGLKRIEESVFYGCVNLESIMIPDGIESIGVRAFYKCERLSSVTLPDSVKIIENSAFCQCFRLPSAIIPEGVKTIGESVFCECRHLTSVTLPNSVTSIGLYAFDKCGALTVTCPSDSYAYRYCSKENFNVNAVYARPGSGLSGISEMLSQKPKKLLSFLGFTNREPIESTLDLPETVSVGDHIKFGRYPQSGGTPEPIIWIVLEVEGSTALMTSEKLLDFQIYLDLEKKYENWKRSELRAWLNKRFLRKAFDAEEQARLIPIEGDTVSTLSVDEAEKYFRRDCDRIAKPTGYVRTMPNSDWCDWWFLRSGCMREGYAAVVDPDGRIHHNGDYTFCHKGVRPMVRIRLA